jgi:hypothetical protein
MAQMKAIDVGIGKTFLLPVVDASTGEKTVNPFIGGSDPEFPFLLPQESIRVDPFREEMDGFSFMIEEGLKILVSKEAIAVEGMDPSFLIGADFDRCSG